ncbi:IclR family transcriptional regulator [Phytohabitans kaempferiae]|uniref:IclR family transcriptional regulator n=1 Tax=Phytohabitans kaempferiae TaxID=1620943 RepID=A0ABV6MHJ3_9ACTN
MSPQAAIGSLLRSRQHRLNVPLLIWQNLFSPHERAAVSQAAEKALMVLEHVTSAREPVSAMAVAGELGLDKSTGSRLLAMLTERGWLVRDDRTRLYSVGPTMVRLGASAAAASTSLRVILLPLLTRLRDHTEETVSFHRLIGDRRVCVAGVESERVIRRALPIGEAFALHIGPTGKAILAFVDPAQREQVLQAAGTEADQVRAYLDAAVRTGVVSTDGDHAPEVAGLSVPVFDQTGVFGALTVAGPVHRWVPALRAQAAPVVLAAARSLSESLGASSGRYLGWEKTLQAVPQGAPA